MKLLRSLSTLQLALLASVAVHAVLLTIRFVDPESFNRVFEDTPLEVVLVNSRSNEKNDKAKAIAQTSLAGGGDAERGRATSPLPPSVLTEYGDSSEEETARKLQTLQEQQTLLLAQVKHQLATMPLPDPNQIASKAEKMEREEKRRQLIKILAEIERRINQQNAKPKKRYISPSVREEVYAVYYDGLRRAIEDKGTENFPESRGKKLYEPQRTGCRHRSGRKLGQSRAGPPCSSHRQVGGSVRTLQQRHAPPGRSDCGGVALQIHPR